MQTRRLPIALCAALLGASTLIHAQAKRPASPPPPVRDFDVVEKTIPELQDAMTAGTITARALAALSLSRIAAYDTAGPAINAMIALNPTALDEAAALDAERREKGPRGPLHGIPIVVKDNYETADMPTTGGTMALAGFQTGRDAFQVAKLRAAGAVILGKTNLHELAAGIITVSSLGGQTRNPYDPARTPGGSSGGSAAAVAASFAVAATASDTCGSIRIPAANNNLFGLRGTAGLSSRRGIVPLSHTQDIGGPLARTVTDLAIMLDATVGPDPEDAVTQGSEAHIPRSYRDALDRGALKGARIGLLTTLLGTAPEDDEVKGIVRKALDAMRAQGAEIIDVPIPGLEEQLDGSSLIALEFKTDLREYLAQFPNAPVHSLGEVIERGQMHAALEPTFRQRNQTDPDPEAIRVAQGKRAAALALVQAALDAHRLDALAYPPLRRRPVVVQEPQRGSTCQLSASTGLPAFSIPAGFTDDGVPIGVELLGRAWSEPRLLAIGYAYEQAVHPRRVPPTTPRLVNGRPPAPVAFTATVGERVADGGARFVYDPVSGKLAWEWTAGRPGQRLAWAAVHRGQPDKPGAVIARLVNPAAPSVAGDIVLPPYQRTELESGALYVEFRTTADPQRAQAIVLRLPGRR